MNIWILTLFPKIFESVFSQSIIKKAQRLKLVKINLVNIRDFSEGKHKTVDDKPYGGGRGMILKVDVTVKALESIKPKPYKILLSAGGTKYDQKKAEFLSAKKNLAIVCGHYEGVDSRIEKFADEVISIGDFVLTGGEIAAMVIVDSTVRLLPRVIKSESLLEESFSKLSTFNFSPRFAGEAGQLSTLLEYPHFTRPKVFRNMKVPKILLSGNHQQIAKWRKEEAVKRTRRYRPDLLKSVKSPIRRAQDGPEFTEGSKSLFARKLAQSRQVKV